MYFSDIVSISPITSGGWELIFQTIIIKVGIITNNSLKAQKVKNLSAMQETQVPFLVQEYPLEKGMATCSSILDWRIPRTEETGGI